MTTTERTGSPHTLVVTKTNYTYDKAFMSWMTRHGRARSQIRHIAQPPQLQMLLGDAYNDLTDLSDAAVARIVDTVKAGTEEQSAPRLPLGNVSNPSSTVAPDAIESDDTTAEQGTKRKNASARDEDTPARKRTQMEPFIDLSESP